MLTDAAGAIVTQGRNRAYDPPGGPDPLQGTPPAHAELNALARARTGWDLATHTLWSSHRPCAMCAAAAAFTGVGTVRYLADDPWPSPPATGPPPPSPSSAPPRTAGRRWWPPPSPSPTPSAPPAPPSPRTHRPPAWPSPGDHPRPSSRPPDPPHHPLAPHHRGRHPLGSRTRLLLLAACLHLQALCCTLWVWPH
ncbi:deaminase [Kitasatospora aureofaciens]|uniref:deaminase n=1 Tax=Kitasatospora aureofaciens TaxID=1894 RepID=UPI00380D755E